MKTFGHKGTQCSQRGDISKTRRFPENPPVRNQMKTLRAFRRLKKFFNLDTFNIDDEDEKEIYLYGSIKTSPAVTENNFSIRSRRRRHRREKTHISTGKHHKNHSNSSACFNNRQKNRHRSPTVGKFRGSDTKENFVTVITEETESTEHSKNHDQDTFEERQSSRSTDRNRGFKVKKKPYFICYKCKNLVPKACGIKCDELTCSINRKCKQIFHAEEYLLIHIAKCHTRDKSQNSNALEDIDTFLTRNDENLDNSKRTEKSQKPKQCKEYKNSLFEALKSPPKKSKSKRRNNLQKFGDHADVTDDQQTTKSSNTYNEKDNGKFYQTDQWLKEAELDTSATSLPSPCTISLDNSLYINRTADVFDKSKKTKKSKWLIDRFNSNKKSLSQVKTVTDPSVKMSNDHYYSSKTKEKLVTMDFLIDHPEVKDKRMLAITNNIKLRVVDSNIASAIQKKRNSVSKAHDAQNSQATNKRREEKDTGSVKKRRKLFKNKSKKESSQMVSQKSNLVSLNNDLKRMTPGQEVVFENKNWNNPDMTDHYGTEEMRFVNPYYQRLSNNFSPPVESRSNFRPTFFADSGLQSQIPHLFQPSRNGRFNSNPFYRPFNPFVYSYSHRRNSFTDYDNAENIKIPKLSSSILLRRNEMQRQTANPPELKYSSQTDCHQSKRQLNNRRQEPFVQTKFASEECHRPPSFRNTNCSRFHEFQDNGANSYMMNNRASETGCGNFRQSNTFKRLNNVYRARQWAQNVK